MCTFDRTCIAFPNPLFPVDAFHQGLWTHTHSLFLLLRPIIYLKGFKRSVVQLLMSNNIEVNSLKFKGAGD